MNEWLVGTAPQFVLLPEGVNERLVAGTIRSLVGWGNEILGHVL